MAAYLYQGRNRSGEPVRGRIEAASADAVAAQLLGSGITPVHINASTGQVDVLEVLRKRLEPATVKPVELIFFCQQMHSLLKAGVPILSSLHGLRDSTKSPVLARVIGQLSDSLDSGSDLTAALARHPKIFSPLFVSMIRVGESTGRLEEAFAQLVVYLERDETTRNRVKSAMRYPTFVVVAVIVAMLVVNLFVIPAFAQIYASFNAELPLATRVLIASSTFMIDNWQWMLALAVAGLWLLRRYLKTDEGRLNWHYYKLKLPVVGKVLYKATLARFARALSMITSAGVPLVDGMAAISRAVDNDYLRSRILNMRDGLERGESITRTATLTGLFPPTVLQMISVGEETGAVDQLTREVADYYDRSVDYDLAGLSAAIEPILTVFIAVLVLMLALGVFLPMWDLAAAARGR